MMRALTALFLLGVFAFSQARKVQLQNGAVNITGLGNLCVDEEYMPVRYLNKSKPFFENCKHHLLGGSLSSDVAGNLKVALGFKRDGLTPISYEVPYEKETKKFNAPAADTFLNQKFSELDCSEPTVTLSSAIEVTDPTTGTVDYKVLASQDFVILNCLEVEQAAFVTVDSELEESRNLSVGLKLLDGTPLPFINLAQVVRSVTVTVNDASLPANGDGVRWPRGLLVFMTRREIKECDVANARMTAHDEMLHFHNLGQALTAGHAEKLSLPEVFFGRRKERSLMCGDVTLVAIYDFLGRYPVRDPCKTFKSVRIHIHCAELANPMLTEPLGFAQPIPNPITQGNTAWLRICDGTKGCSLLKFDRAFKSRGYKFINSPYELKGAGRVLVTATIFNKYQSTLCMGPVLENDDLLGKEKELAGLLTPLCKEFVSNALRDDEFYYPEFMEKLKSHCNGNPTVVRLFSPGEKKKEIWESMAKGLCPDNGFRPDDMYHDDMSERSTEDKFYMEWAENMQRAVKAAGGSCSDDVGPGFCGFRAVAQLMSSGQRLLANVDLWYEHAAKEDYTAKFDDVKPMIDTILGTDSEALRACPRPDIWKPYDVYPATWIMDEEGVSIGFHSALHSKWCFTRVMRWGCSECASKDAFASGDDGLSGDGK